MKSTKDVVCCVVDSGGSYVALSQRLSKEYQTVYYVCPSWIDAYPKMNKAMIGTGLPGVNVVSSPFDVYAETDLWVFPDCYQSAFEEFLFDQGELVWGSRNGEEMETERGAMKEHMKSIGLPVQAYEIITGMTALRDYLKEHEDVYVKISKWRGTIETFHSENYMLIKPQLDEMEHDLGSFAEILEFILEEPIDSVEVGYDGFTVDGQFPEIWISGCEIKDKAYAGEITEYKNLPEAVKFVNEKLVDTLKSYKYRGFISTEIRIGKDGKPYLLDMTCRCPCPPGSIYLAMFDNLGEIIWAGANGEMRLPKAAKKFGVEVLMDSEWACKNFQPVYYPEESSVYLKKNMIQGEVNTIIPQSYPSSDIGSVVGLGDKLDEAIASCRATVEQIKGNGITIHPEALDDAQEELDKSKGL